MCTLLRTVKEATKLPFPIINSLTPPTRFPPVRVSHRQLLHVYQGARDAVWGLLPLPLAALPLPPHSLEGPSSSASWLYDVSSMSSSNAQPHTDQNGGGNQGEREEAGDVFWGNSFVSTSRCV